MPVDAPAFCPSTRIKVAYTVYPLCSLIKINRHSLKHRSSFKRESSLRLLLPIKSTWMEAGAYEKHLKAASRYRRGEGRDAPNRSIGRSKPSRGHDRLHVSSGFWQQERLSYYLFLVGLQRELKEDCLSITSRRWFGLFGKEIKRNDWWWCLCEKKSIDRGDDDDDERVINLSSFRRGRDSRLFVRRKEEKKRGGLTDARVKTRRRGGLSGQKRKTGQTSLSIFETPRATETEQRGFFF